LLFETQVSAIYQVGKTFPLRCFVQKKKKKNTTCWRGVQVQTETAGASGISRLHTLKADVD